MFFQVEAMYMFTQQVNIIIIFFRCDGMVYSAVLYILFVHPTPTFVHVNISSKICKCFVSENHVSIYPAGNIIVIFLQLLGQNSFHDLAHHIIIGNQAIVRGSVRSLMRSVIDCLIVRITQSPKVLTKCLLNVAPPSVTSGQL